MKLNKQHACEFIHLSVLRKPGIFRQLKDMKLPLMFIPYFTLLKKRFIIIFLPYVVFTKVHKEYFIKNKKLLKKKNLFKGLLE